MSKFFDNVTGKQKLILIFGIIVLLVLARRFLPEETQWLVDSVRGLFESIGHFFGDVGEHTE